MGLPKPLIQNYPELDEWSIMTAYRGSIVHGTYRPNSEPNSIDDKDVMAICVPPEEYIFGLKTYGSKETREIKQDEWDIVCYSLKKFIGLLCKGNPNVVSMLWLDPNYYIKLTNHGETLIHNRRLFSSKNIYHSFTGYAYSQLKRIIHYKFEGYMGEKRKSLVDKFGFDTKNASHLIRLLRMSIEFLNDHKFYVLREDASQLLDIKNGLWPLEKIKEESDRLFKRAEEAYDRCTLPVSPDYEKIYPMVIRILKKVLVERDKR